MVIEATYRYDAAMRADDQCGEFMRALLLLMRWTGLRISDATMAARWRLQGDRYVLKMIKGGAPLTVILPPHVVAALNALPARDDIDPRYFFWSGKSKNKSLTSTWQKKFARLNDFLSLVDYDEENPQPIRFHSHQCRDTFAVEHLLDPS
jgi:hypothetical protein